jgi:hypothetical protein
MTLEESSSLVAPSEFATAGVYVDAIPSGVHIDSLVIRSNPLVVQRGL